MCAQGHPVWLFAIVTLLPLLPYYYCIGYYDIILICYSLNFSDMQGYKYPKGIYHGDSMASSKMVFLTSEPIFCFIAVCISIYMIKTKLVWWWYIDSFDIYTVSTFLATFFSYICVIWTYVGFWILSTVYMCIVEMFILFTFSYYYCVSFIFLTFIELFCIELT